MKQNILILLLVCFLKTYSQKIEKKVGDYRITKETFILEKKKGKTDYYFDKTGKILEYIKFGKPHNSKLSMIGAIEQYFYTDNNLISSKKYVSECNCNSYYLYNSKFKYNADNKLLSENIYRGNSDSLFMSKKYIYKDKIREIHIDSSTYFKNKYDDENRIVEQNQIFEGKIRWKKEFAYSPTYQANKFQTFYGNGNENTELELIKYDSQKRIVSKEKFREKSKTMIYYNYSKNGLIEKIEESESDNDEKYKLKYTTIFKIKKREKIIDKLVAEKINSQLIDETSI